MRVVDPKTGRICFRKSRKRYDRDCSPRELTFSCYRRFPFLARDRVRNWFVESIQAARRTWPVDLWAWVILPEHVHLLVAPREPKIAVGRFAGAIKEQTARRAIQWLESNSPAWIERITVREGRRTRRRFWQPGGGYDRNVLEVETLHEMIDYLHLNPVRRGFVAAFYRLGMVECPLVCRYATSSPRNGSHDPDATPTLDAIWVACLTRSRRV